MNVFRVMKKSGTYSDLLEAYGLSNLLHEIMERCGEDDASIEIFDKNTFYEIQISLDITSEILEKLRYFPLFRYVKCQYSDDDIIKSIVDFYDYLSDKEQKDKSDNFNVYQQIATKNNMPSFNKLYSNFHYNQPSFRLIINEILRYYAANKSDEILQKKNLIKFNEKITAIQLYNPDKGKGANSEKANALRMDGLKSSWIAETMKVSGALSDMICQLIKVDGTGDLKIYIPSYTQLNYSFKEYLMLKLRKNLNEGTSVKMDIINILSLVQILLSNNEYIGKRRKIKNIVSGFHSVYQKNMNKVKAVINIGFLQVPSFIEIGTKEENERWIDIINEQKRIISKIDENKGVQQGLMKYRDFLSTSNIDCFFAFTYWFASFLFNKITKKKEIELYSIESLDKLYYSMDTKELKLMEIIENKGFQAIAKAIRNSTVSLQYTPKENRKFEVRYGVAQSLQIKAKSPEDLAAYIGEFIALYNAETARNFEKGGDGKRITVREDELNDFYSLLDLYPSYLIGALLASYGFALPQKDNNRGDENNGVDNK